MVALKKKKDITILNAYMPKNNLKIHEQTELKGKTNRNP